MSVNAALAAKSRQHTVYKLADGTRVPGVTTVLNILAKPALINWANRMGLQGIDTTKYVDAAANAGTCCHAMIEAHLKGETFDGSSFDPATIDIAENGYLKYLDWEGQHTLSNIHSEMQLVSEAYKYGGTIDLYCTLDGVPTLVDFKTNQSGIYDEMMHQVAGGYRVLLGEHGMPVKQVLIIRVGKTENMDMETRFISDWQWHENVFLDALRLYNTLNRK